MPAFGTDPFQTPLEYGPLRVSRRVAMDAQAQMFRPAGSGYLHPFYKATKFLTYLVPGSANALQAAKFQAYIVPGSPDALQVSKFIAYVLLEPAPLWRFDQEWPQPLRPRRLQTQGDVWASNSLLLAPAAGDDGFTYIVF